MPPTSDFSCPTCGGEVHPNAKSCPHCGTEPERWSTGGVIIDDPPDLGIPDEDYDYDEFVSREFGKGGKLRRNPSPRIKPVWVITAFGLVGIIVILIVTGLW